MFVGLISQHARSAPGFMRRWRALPRWVLAVSLAASTSASHAQSLTIFAAASMKEVIEEMLSTFESGTGARAVASFASSAALARQIERGAPADLFVSADQEWMDHLARRGLIVAGTRSVLARNRLVLIAPAERAVKVEIVAGFPLRHLLGNSRLALGDPDYVPAGRYARAALQSLGVWESVKDRLAPAENVRAALNFVSRGEVPLGIVYQTDAAVEAKVRIAGSFPQESHPVIEYPVAVVATTRQPEAARRLLAHLRSAASGAVLDKYGFAGAR